MREAQEALPEPPVNRLPIAEGRADPEEAACLPSQDEDQDFEDPELLDDPAREEMEGRVRLLAHDLAELNWEDQDALLRLMSNELFDPL